MNAAALKAAGFSDAEIQNHTNEQKLLAAGFSPEEISAPKTKPSFMDYAKDVAKSGLTGLTEGITGAIGLPGTLTEMVAPGAPRILPTSEELNKAIAGTRVTSPMAANQGVVGPLYQPKTVPGEYSRTLGQFAPSAAVGPAGTIPKIASVAVPAIASEAAGQQFKGTAAEGPARFVAALAAPAAMNTVVRGGKAIANALKGVKPASIVDEVAPTIGQQYQAKNDLYDAVFKDPNKNVIISKDALSRLSDKVQNIAAAFGYKPTLNPKTKDVIDDIMNLPKSNSTLMGLEMSRRVATNVAQDRLTSDGKLSGQITKAITDFMDDLDDVDIIGTQAHGIAQNVKTTPNALTVPGSVQPGGVADLTGPSILKNARSTYRTMKKSKTIQNVIDNAEITAGVNYSQAGVEQALQRGFANLAKNSKRMGQFTPEEQTAIKLAAKGTNVQNALKFLGKFAVRGPVSAGVTSFLGQGLGPAGPYVLAGIGEAAKRGAASGTQASVDALSALVRGGPSAAQNLQALKTARALESMRRYAPAVAGSATRPDTQSRPNYEDFTQ